MDHMFDMDLGEVEPPSPPKVVRKPVSVRRPLPEVTAEEKSSVREPIRITRSYW